MIVIVAMALSALAAIISIAALRLATLTARRDAARQLTADDLTGLHYPQHMER